MRIRALNSTVAVLLSLTATSVAGVQEEQAPDVTGPEALEVGAPPPTGFELRSIDGDTYRLADLRGERPVLLLFFRGTW